MSEEKKVVRVKLVKHEWPDERAARHKRQRNIMLVILLCGAFFAGGFGLSALTRSSLGNGTEMDAKFSIVQEVMQELWYFGKDAENLDETLLNGAISGMVDAGGDIHTQYMDPEYAESFISSMEGNLVGIGIQYTSALDINRIYHVFPGSPADIGGLKSGDVIIAVDGIDVRDNDTVDLAELVRGEEGSEVVITVDRDGEVLDFTITRGSFDSSVYAYTLDDVGILEINTFGETTANGVGSYLSQMKENGIENLIIDLRDNTGGYLTTVVDIGSYLLPDGDLILQEENRDGSVVQYYSKDSIETIPFENIVVLINGNTASASEVLTAALRENLGATVVGTLSYGKGTVQTSIPFNDGSIIKYTKAEWLTPNGNKINGVGITPDIEVELPLAVQYGIPDETAQTVALDSVSQECMLAQINLDFLGYDIDRTDGYFSAQTLNALQQFERDHGYEVNDELNAEVLRQTSMQVFDKWYDDINELDPQLNAALEVVHGR